MCYKKFDSSITTLRFKKKILYLFIFGCAVSSLLCGLFCSSAHRLLIAVASLAERRFQGAQASVLVTHGLSSCVSQTLKHKLSSCGSWV